MMPDLHSSEVSDLLRDLDLGGVLLPGSLAYDAYPQAGVLTLTAGGSVNTDGAYGSLVAAAGIANPYRVLNLVVGDNSAGNQQKSRYTLRTGGATVRRITEANGSVYTAGAEVIRRGHMALFSPSLLVTGGEALEAAVASSVASLTYAVNATVLKREPLVIPELMRLSAKRAGARLPSGTAGGTALTASATAWAWGAYVELTAGLSKPVLICSVTIYNGSSAMGQVELATGPATETPWSTFPCAAEYVFGFAMHNLPWRLLLPANTRLAARARHATASAVMTVAVEYIELPSF